MGVETRLQLRGRQKGNNNYIPCNNAMFCSITSVTTLGPIRPPIQRVLRALLWEVKQPKHKATHSPPSSSEIRNE
jgi:hypothetical protein